eukprot:356457-Chlamydomonas_euryale.AAC.4
MRLAGSCVALCWCNDADGIAYLTAPHGRMYEYQTILCGVRCQNLKPSELQTMDYMAQAQSGSR